MNLVIYGAQGIALGAYKAIKVLFPEKKILCFLVTELEMNAPILAGIPVQELKKFVSGLSQNDKDNIEVLIGTPESVMETIEDCLEEVGLHNYERLDSIRWAELMRRAYEKTGEFMPLIAYPVGNRKPNMYVYKMVHAKDKKLKTKYIDPDYMITMQVGAKMSDVEIAPILDDSDDNISEKNGNYSELTGLYWVWKNRVVGEKNKNDSFYGVAHYRRMLDFSEDDLYRLLSNDIDVVLPYAMPYEPNIEAHHAKYLTNTEWNAVLTALQELQPEYAQEFKRILKQQYFYNYNIFLAKPQVLDDYCSWLFPILFRIEEINDPSGIKEPNRYIGYVGETLETLYFMYNKQKLRITYVGCRFLT